MLDVHVPDIGANCRAYADRTPACGVVGASLRAAAAITWREGVPRHRCPLSGRLTAGLHEASHYVNVFSTWLTASSIESYTRFSSSSVMVNGRYIVMMLP